MEYTPILPPSAPVVPMGFTALPQGRFALYALSDPRHALQTLSRDQLGETVEALIAILDVTEGDADFEDATDAEDDFAFSPAALFEIEGAGCDHSDAGESDGTDEGDHAWIEWPYAAWRKHMATLGHEDAEEDDHSGEHASEDDPSGWCTMGGRHSGPGCPIADPGGCGMDEQ